MKTRAKRPCRILVVDDEESAHQAIRRALDGDGYEVSKAITSEQALGRLKNGHFDALIVDRAFIGIKGDNLARRAKAKWPDLAIIMTTAFATEFNLAGVQFQHVDCILDKTFERVEVLAAIAQVSSPVAFRRVTYFITRTS